MPHPKQGYRDKDGKKIPGVTTIIGRFKESGGLLWWAYAQGQANERGEIGGLYEKRDEAGDAGTLAHALVEAYIDKTPAPGLPDNEVGRLAIQGFQNYMTWQQDNGLVVVEQEMGMVSEEYKFAGTPDAVAFNGRGQLALIDWKNSSGIYRDYLLQLAAYIILWNENHPDQPIDGGAHICRFSKTHADFEHRFFENLDDETEMFLLLRKAYSLDLKLKKRVK